MASWLSSRLKAAEQLLQQIDQQAAITKEQLQKPDSDLTSFLSPDIPRGGRRTNNDQPSSNSMRSETLNLPSQSGNGKSRHAKRSQPAQETRNNEVVPGPSKQDDFGKRDWTEILGSTDLNPPPSASRSSSSVGSTDFGGAQNASRGGSQRAFHTAGKVYLSAHDSNDSTPASKLNLAGTGLPPPSSVQASRTKGPSRYMEEVRESASHLKSDNQQEDESVPRKLEYGAQIVEGTGQNVSNEHPMGITPGPDVSADPFIQPVNQDGEFTELELSAPEDTKELEFTNPRASSSDNFVEDAPKATSMLLEQTTVPVHNVESTDPPTLTRGDAVSLADEEEAHRSRIQAGDCTLQEGGDQGGEDCDTAEEIVDQSHVAHTLQGVDRHVDDKASGEDSEVSGSSDTDDQSQNGSGSGSGSGSGTESDSEYEERVRRRRDRRKELAERRAAKAAAAEAARAAIRDREVFVAKLEQEREDLEKLLAEVEERQVKEAEELNLTVKEVAEAVEIEKQRHALTRRVGLAREAQLEAQNQELAKALAAAERNLEDENARVALARSKVEAKEIIQSDLQRKILLLEYRLRPPPQPLELVDSKTERETAEEHYAELAARLEQFQNKAKQLEEKIFIARDAHYTPSVMELELETRLNQLTDHLIQKQSQVEALSTEKATLHFRLEAIASTLRVEKSAAQSRASKRSKGLNAPTDWSTYDDDLEYGLSKPYSSKDKSGVISTDPDVILNQTTGSQPMKTLARQVDSVFLVGARILRTSGSARAMAALYIFLLHTWVLFILFMHTRSGGSGSTAEVQAAGVNTLSSLTHTLNSTALNR